MVKGGSQGVNFYLLYFYTIQTLVTRRAVPSSSDVAFRVVPVAPMMDADDLSLSACHCSATVTMSLGRKHPADSD